MICQLLTELPDNTRLNMAFVLCKKYKGHSHRLGDRQLVQEVKTGTLDFRVLLCSILELVLRKSKEGLCLLTTKYYFLRQLPVLLLLCLSVQQAAAKKNLF